MLTVGDATSRRSLVKFVVPMGALLPAYQYNFDLVHPKGPSLRVLVTMQVSVATFARGDNRV